MKALVDSNILVDFLNNRKEAVAELAKRDLLGVSIISYIEVLSGIKDIETQADVRNFFEEFEVIEINKQIAEEAIKIRSHSSIKLPDALILATAVVNNVVLITRDDGFKNHPNAYYPYKI